MVGWWLVKALQRQPRGLNTFEVPADKRRRNDSFPAKWAKLAPILPTCRMLNLRMLNLKCAKHVQKSLDVARIQK
jgi:hypothetical protein